MLIGWHTICYGAILVGFPRKLPLGKLPIEIRQLLGLAGKPHCKWSVKKLCCEQSAVKPKRPEGKLFMRTVSFVMPPKPKK